VRFLRLGNKTLNARESRLLADRGDADPDTRVGRHGARDYSIAVTFGDRSAFAGHH
jgi:hypothetical protein